MAAVLAVMVFSHANYLIKSASFQCIAQDFEICQEFVPWLWVGIAFSGIGSAALIGWFARRVRFAASFVPVLLVSLLFPTGYSLWLWFQSSEYSTTASNEGSSNRKADDLSRRAELAQTVTETELSSPGGRHPFPGLPQSRDGLPLEDDPFLATSKAEQSWLDRNGYPNAKQWAVYTQASDMQLEEAAKQGDRGAKAILEHRRLLAGDQSGITDLLTEAANGSGFALDMLASYLASSRGGDRKSAYAISRVSEMRGNLRVAGARDLMFETPLTNSERMEGEQEAMEIYRSLDELQQQTRPNSSPVDPRPIGG